MPAARSQSAAKDTRVALQPAFVLHSYPYKETSLILELFSRDYGRVPLVAKGAKRPTSALRAVLQTFQPLNASWTGKMELRTLTGAEWVGGMLPLEGSALLCGFYLNELLMKLLARDDPHPALFDRYLATLNELARGEPATFALRKFELALLRETGVGHDLSRCAATASPVIPDLVYVIDPTRGAVPAQDGDIWPRARGKTLQDMAAGDYSDPVTQNESKLLMRALLAYHLNDTPLQTRQILLDLARL